jgi:hypothetical protein
MRADAANAVPEGFLATGSDAEAALSHFITSGTDGGCVLVGHTQDYAAYLPVAVRSLSDSFRPAFTEDAPPTRSKRGSGYRPESWKHPPATRAKS